MDCPQCGKPLEEGSTNCSSCGAAVEPQAGSETGTPQEEPAASSTPAPLPAPSPERDEAPSPGAARRSMGKSRRNALILGGVGLLVIAAVVLVLVFVVFKGDTDGGGKQEVKSDPRAAVELFFQGIVDADVDALISAIDPVYMEEFEAEYGQDYRDLLAGFFLAVNPEGLEITGLEFEVEKNGDEAVIKIIAGTATYLDANGERVTEEVTENVITDFETVRVDGQWYVSMSTFPDWWYYLNAMTDGGS